LDPSGDGELSPVDVLIVINYINTHGSGPIPETPFAAEESGGRVQVAEGESGSIYHPCKGRDLGSPGEELGGRNVLDFLYPVKR
jgi:hypothetical protein